METIHLRLCHCDSCIKTGIPVNFRQKPRSVIHGLPPKKGVHQLRFFLPTMRTPNSIVVCSCIYAFVLKWDPMCNRGVMVYALDDYLVILPENCN